MKHIKTLLLVIGIASGLFHSIQAQDLFKVSSPSEVAVGRRFQVSFIIETTESVSDFKAPSFRNANIVFGPSRGQNSSYSNINGQITRSHQVSFTYYLVAPAEGTVTIPPASVSVGGKIYKTTPHSIKVVKDNPQSAPASAAASSPSTSENIDANSLFLRATASKSHLTKGEEVIISYKLYTAVGVSECQITQPPASKGFWLEDLPGKEHLGTEVIDGKKYDVFELRRFAAYPQTDGNLIIDPMEIEINVVLASRSNSFFDSFFGGGTSYRRVPKKLKSNSLNLSTSPLPTPPEGFNGAVGSFDLKSAIDSSVPKTGEPITIRYTISGSGNIQLINTIDPRFPRDFEVYEPKTFDNLSRGYNGVSGSKTFEYILIPRIRGEYTIPPVTLTYYNPKKKTYKTIASQPHTIKVSKGSSTPSSATVYLNDKEQYKNRDIEYLAFPKRGIQNFTLWITSGWYWMILAGMVLAFAAVFGIKHRQTTVRKDISRVRWQRSHRIAKKRMAVAKKNLQKGNQEPFYASVSQAIWGYLSDKYNINLAQLSMENIQSILSGRNINQETIHNIIQTLEHCEYARFAPADGTDSMNQMYDEALELIAQVESQQK